MLALIQYVKSADLDKEIVSVRFSDQILYKTSINSESDLAWCAMKIYPLDVEKFAKLVNDPTHAKVRLPPESTDQDRNSVIYATDVIVSDCGTDPYVIDKLTPADIAEAKVEDIRPAAIRAASTSLFANL